VDLQCRRNPPIHDDLREYKNPFPLVVEDEWCGEFVFEEERERSLSIAIKTPGYI